MIDFDLIAWDPEENERHVAEHDLTTEEVDAVFDNPFSEDDGHSSGAQSSSAGRLPGDSSWSSTRSRRPEGLWSSTRSPPTRSRPPLEQKAEAF